MVVMGFFDGLFGTKREPTIGEAFGAIVSRAMAINEINREIEKRNKIHSSHSSGHKRNGHSSNGNTSDYYSSSDRLRMSASQQNISESTRTVEFSIPCDGVRIERDFQRDDETGVVILDKNEKNKGGVVILDNGERLPGLMFSEKKGDKVNLLFSINGERYGDEYILPMRKDTEIILNDWKLKKKAEKEKERKKKEIEEIRELKREEAKSNTWDEWKKSREFETTDGLKQKPLLEPVMILVKKSCFKRGYDEKSGKFTDEIALRPYKNKKPSTDGKVSNFAVLEIPPIRDSHMKPTFITVNEACIRKPKIVTERMRDNGMDLDNCVYVILPRVLAVDGKSESNTVSGYQIVGRTENGYSYKSFKINPSAVERAMPRYFTNKQKENFKSRNDGKLPERIMFKPIFDTVKLTPDSDGGRNPNTQTM